MDYFVCLQHWDFCLNPITFDSNLIYIQSTLKTFVCNVIYYHIIYCRIEVFDADKLGKDKSLGQVTIDPRDLMDGDSKWFPLQVTFFFTAL